jgi:uncharacterized membrane protein YcjF (UPF0283 family)
LIVIGIIAAFLSATAETPEALLLGTTIASSALGVGIILILVGYIVRALFFLPGREVLEAEITGTISGVTSPVGTETLKIACEWCDQWVALPNVPCSDVELQRLREIAGDITNSKCRVQLMEHGILDTLDD